MRRTRKTETLTRVLECMHVGCNEQMHKLRWPASCQLGSSYSGKVFRMTLIVLRFSTMGLQTEQRHRGPVRLRRAAGRKRVEPMKGQHALPCRVSRAKHERVMLFGRTTMATPVRSQSTRYQASANPTLQDTFVIVSALAFLENSPSSFKRRLRFYHILFIT